MKSPVIIVLGEQSIAIARQIQTVIAGATIYGLASRTQTADREYDKFSETISDLFSQGHPIIGICAAGILIRSLASLLSDKRAEPPVIAIAEDGSAVVPLLGGLNGAIRSLERSRMFSKSDQRSRRQAIYGFKPRYYHHLMAIVCLTLMTKQRLF